MNQDQANHLRSVLKQSESLISDKYIKGVIEHKTTLNKDHSVNELVDMAIEEAVDQIVFLLTIKEVLESDGSNS